MRISFSARWLTILLLVVIAVIPFAYLLYSDRLDRVGPLNTQVRVQNGYAISAPFHISTDDLYQIDLGWKKQPQSEWVPVQFEWSIVDLQGAILAQGGTEGPSGSGPDGNYALLTRSYSTSNHGPQRFILHVPVGAESMTGLAHLEIGLPEVCLSTSYAMIPATLWAAAFMLTAFAMLLSLAADLVRGGRRPASSSSSVLPRI